MNWNFNEFLFCTRNPWRACVKLADGKVELSEDRADFSRRKAMKSIAAGSAIVGAAALIPLETLLKKSDYLSNSTKKSGIKVLAPVSDYPSVDNVGYFAYAYLGQVGTETPTRNSDGSIASINYQNSGGTAGVNVTVTREADGSISSISNNLFDNNSSPLVNITATQTVNRNPDGSIQNVVWS